jgi:hypothetical protein
VTNYVYWPDDSVPGREVKRACNRCYGRAVSVNELEYEVVSRYGTAHKEGMNGKTACGIDASGDSRWWHAQ